MRTQIKRSDKPQGRTQVRRSEASDAGAYAGNSATEGYLRSMTVSSPTDAAEVDARRNADAVMAGGQAYGSDGGASGGFEAPQDVAGGIDAASRGPAQALPQELGGQMAEAMGHGFDDVRIHDDPSAHAMSQSLEASAFTAGRDIFFGAGQYRPDSHEGQHLIAHELTHVAQDSGMIFRSPNDPQTTTNDQNSTGTGGTQTSTDNSGGQNDQGGTASPPATTTAAPAPTDPTLDDKGNIKDEHLNDKAIELKGKLANPLVKRVLLIMLRIKAKGSNIIWKDVKTDDDTLSDVLDMAAAGLGMTAAVSDLGGVATDSVAAGRGKDADGEVYGSGITDIISGVAGAAGSGVSMANTIIGEGRNRKQDRDAKAALSPEEQEILKENPEFLKDTGSGDALGATLKTIGAGASGAGSLLFGVSGGGVGLSANYRERNDMDGHVGRANTAGGLGVAGAGLGAVGSGIGAVADWINVGKNSGGDKPQADFKKALGAEPSSAAVIAPADLKADSSLDEKKKCLHSVLKIKSVDARMTALKLIRPKLDPAKADEQALHKAATTYMLTMFGGHGQKKAGKDAWRDAVLSTTDTAGGIINTIGVGLTSFMGDNAWAQGFGLAFRGLAALTSLATNAIGMKRKTSKQARNKLGARNEKYGGRVGEVIGLITSLPEVYEDGKFGSCDIVNFARGDMNETGKKEVKDKTTTASRLNNLGEYVDMVETLKDQVNILHLAAAAGTDENAELDDKEKAGIASAIAAGMGK